MPEGDTLFRTAAGLRPYLVGRDVTAAHAQGPGAVPQVHRVVGKRIDAIEAQGKNLLIRFDGGLELRTHLRMHGSWHIYRPGERWQRPRHEMRIVIETRPYVAVAFTVPVAEFLDAASVEREGVVAELGPDLLSDRFDAATAVARLRERGDLEVADALLDQRAIAGIGNVYKSEVLFASRISPFTPVRDLDDETLARIVTVAERQMRANVGGSAEPGAGSRRTTNRLDPSARLWVYGRARRACRRCGTAIEARKQGAGARLTYWCPTCQPS